jgi:CelD/BcsL family acetyltransferase involved in cellulose biosynthesis
MVVEEAARVEELESLHEEWLALWQRCPGATPFQSPDWLLPWWKHLGSGELWVLALRQEGRLTGVAPFFIRTAPGSGRREVLLLGTGISDYLDVLLEPGTERCGTEAILSCLEHHSGRWDLCDFQQLRGESPLLEAQFQPPWLSELAVQEVCPVLALPGRLDQLPRQLPARMLGKLWYCRRCAEKSSARMEAASAERFSDLFEGMLDLHRARWAGQGLDGPAGAARLKAFHREAAARFLAAGALRLYGLRLGDRLAATFYGFTHGRRTFFYLAGFEPEFAPLNPATLMIGYAIEQAISEGVSEFDFLRGREAYKYLWGARGRLNYRRRAGDAKTFKRHNVEPLKR